MGPFVAGEVIAQRVHSQCGATAGAKIDERTLNSWNSYFIGLTASEFAAADECGKVSAGLLELQLVPEANEYRDFAVQERNHGMLAAKLITRSGQPSRRASEMFSGVIFEETDQPLLARLMAIHFVFEPSALVILGYLCSHAQRHFERELADVVGDSTARILRDEVAHVRDGKNVIQKLIRSGLVAPPSDKTKRLIRFLYHFVRLGFASFFKEVPEFRPEVEEILSRFQKQSQNLVSEYGVAL